MGYELTGILPEGWSIETGTAAYGYGRDGGAIQLQIYDDTGAVRSIEDLLKREVLTRK